MRVTRHLSQSEAGCLFENLQGLKAAAPPWLID